MANYYFLGALLPPLKWGEKALISFKELKVFMEEILTPVDQQLVKKLLSFVDVSNIRQLLLEEPIDEKGNLSEKELDEALLIHEGLPEYVFDFLKEFEKTSDRLRYFSKIMSEFFVQELADASGFLQRYFTFEREWRLVMLGIRAKQSGRDLARELQFEDPHDPLIAHLLAQKDADRYDPPVEYQELKEIMHRTAPDPLEEYRVFSAYRLRQIEAMEEGDVFSMDAILSYVARLMILEEDNELSDETGKQVLEGMVGS